MTSPDDLLAFADSLKFTPGAARRAAISRAYYAAFHSLQDAVAPLVPDEAVGRNGCAAHGAVLQALRTWQSSHPDRKTAMAHGAEALKCFHLMQTCLQEREKADYVLGMGSEFSAQDAIGIIGKASRVMKFASKF